MQLERDDFAILGMYPLPCPPPAQKFPPKMWVQFFLIQSLFNQILRLEYGVIRGITVGGGFETKRDIA